jgi:hypothetical protein
MKIKTSDLTLLALDWAVAKITNPEWWDDGYMDGDPMAALDMDDGAVYSPSTNWAQGGPIIEREGIAIDVVRAGWTIDSWVAALVHEDEEFDGVARAEEYGPTPLVAAMRCYVASKLGDEVEIPEELA